MTSKQATYPLLVMWLRYIGFPGAGNCCQAGVAAAQYLSDQVHKKRISDTELWDDAPEGIKTSFVNQFGSQQLYYVQNLLNKESVKKSDRIKAAVEAEIAEIQKKIEAETKKMGKLYPQLYRSNGSLLVRWVKKGKK